MRRALTTALLAASGLLGVLASPAAADGPAYTDSGVNADGYHQIAVQPGGTPPPADTSAGDYRADVSWQTPDGRTRTYRIIVPAGLSGPAPYVVAMGGLFLSLANTQATQAWETHAPAGRFVVVYASGLGSSFNAGVCCGWAHRNGIDDDRYLTDLLALADAQLPRDPARTMLAGFSNGGMMAYAYACSHPGTVSAIGVDAGTNESDCDPSKLTTPVAVRHLHGDADTTVPYEGSPYSSSLDCPLTAVPPVLDDFAKADKHTWAPVAASLVPGMGHRWPTAAGGDPIDATSEFVDFLLANPRR